MRPTPSREATRDTVVKPAAQEPRLCDDCDKVRTDISYCNVCTMNYCDDCWPKVAPHRKQRGKVRHEKTNVADAQKIERVLSPPKAPETLMKLYEDDEQTSWFGRLNMHLVDNILTAE